MEYFRQQPFSFTKLSTILDRVEKIDDYARGKLEKKALDMIIANRVGDDCGFDSDDNSVNVLWADGELRFAETSKTELAHDLIELVARRFYAARGTDTQPRLTVIANTD